MLKLTFIIRSATAVIVGGGGCSTTTTTMLYTPPPYLTSLRTMKEPVNSIDDRYNDVYVAQTYFDARKMFRKILRRIHEQVSYSQHLGNTVRFDGLWRAGRCCRCWCSSIGITSHPGWNRNGCPCQGIDDGEDPAPRRPCRRRLCGALRFMQRPTTETNVEQSVIMHIGINDEVCRDDDGYDVCIRHMQE